MFRFSTLLALLAVPFLLPMSASPSWAQEGDDSAKEETYLEVKISLDGKASESRWASKIRKALRKLTGVLETQVDVESKRAIVRYDPEKVDTAAILKRIRKARFTASLASPVTTVYRNDKVEVRVMPEAQEFDAGAEGKVKVTVVPSEGTLLTMAMLNWEEIWKRKAGTANVHGKLLGEVSEAKTYTLKFSTPEKQEKGGSTLHVQMSYRVGRGAPDGSDVHVRLEVPILVKHRD